jgi:hypothetical protein
MAEKVKVIMGGREKVLERRLAEALVKIGKVKIVGENTYKTRMMVAETTDSKDELKKILDAAGVEYDRRLGEAKLRELVNSIKD